METFITINYEENIVIIDTNALVQGTYAKYLEIHYLHNSSRFRKDIKRLPSVAVDPELVLDNRLLLPLISI